MNFNSEVCFNRSYGVDQWKRFRQEYVRRKSHPVRYWDEWFQTSRYLVQNLGVLSRSCWPLISRGESTWKSTSHNRTIDSWTAVHDQWPLRSSSGVQLPFKSPVEEWPRAGLRHQVGRSTSLHDKSSRWRHIGHFVQENIFNTQTIWNLLWHCISKIQNRKREPASYSRWKWFVVMWRRR